MSTVEIALSPREREVADLVAQGFSNREIAERLVISERTAEGHVEQIRNKLGFHSRAQVAAWVAAQRAGATARLGPSVTARSATAPPTATAASVAASLERPFVVVRVPSIPRAAIAVALTVLLIVVAVVAFWPRTSASSLVLVAGIGSRGYSGDNGPATAAQIDEPTSMVIDRNGALIFADSYQQDDPSSSAIGGTHLRWIGRPAGVVRAVAGERDSGVRFNVAEIG